MPQTILNLSGNTAFNVNETPHVASDSENEVVTDHFPKDGRLDVFTAAQALIHDTAQLVLSRLIHIGGNVLSRNALSTDAQHLAAASLINSSQIAVLNTAIGTMYVIGVRAREAIANNHPSDIGILYRNGVIMSFVLGVPALLFTQFTGALFKLAQQPSDVTDIIDRHNRLYCFAVPANILLAQNIQILFATKNYSALILNSSLYTALLVPLSYGLMNGYGPLPQLDAQGVGLANLITSWASVLTTTLYLFCSSRYRSYPFLKAPPAENPELNTSALLRKGLPIGVQIGLETFYVVVLTELIGLIRQEDLSASVPAWHTASILTTMIFNLGQVSAIRTIDAVEQKRFQDARQYGYVSLLIGCSIPITALLLFAAAPDYVVSWFINKDAVGNETIFDQAKLFLWVATASLIPDAIRNVASGTLRAYNDTTFAMCSSMFSIAAVGMLASVLLGFKTSLGSFGVFLGRALAFTVSAFMVTSYWHRKSHAVTDENNFNTERNRSLNNNIEIWIKNLFPPFFKFWKNVENTQPSTVHEEERGLLSDRVQDVYRSYA